MLSTRPLFANDSDARWYVEVAAARRFSDSVSSSRNTLLVGETGSGKTTVLHMTELEVRESRRPIAFLSFAAIDDVGQAVVALVRTAATQGWITEPDERLLQAALAASDPFAPNMALRLLGAIQERTVVLLDDVHAPVTHALFGRLRDELWQIETLTWGVAVARDEAAPLMSPPAAAFFDARVLLEALSPDERRDILKRRATRGEKLTREQIERLTQDGPANPRGLIALARDALTGTGPTDEMLRGVEARLSRAEAVGGRPAAMLVTEMEPLGPVSASDPRLLDRLGWTRPRAAGLLGELEEAGIVRAHRDRPAGPGRPRKLYELRAPEEFL